MPKETIKCLDCGKVTDNFYTVIRKRDRGLYSTKKCSWCHELEIRQAGILACIESKIKEMDSE